MSISKYINDDNVLNIYQLGSRVYGSHTKESDYDYILVVKQLFDTEDINIHVYTETSFRLSLDNHDIQALECVYLDEKFIIKETIKFNVTIDRYKLRPAISTISSNSYVKAKKKLIVSGDYDLNLALKSFFHSYRILEFGIQIASENKITNYSCANWLLDDLKSMSVLADRDQLWINIEHKYKEMWNKKASQFKSLCPKNTSKQLYIEKLNNLFKNENLCVKTHKNLIEDIYNLLK